MILIHKKQLEAMKKYLKIEEIISIRFSDTKTANFNNFKDTIGTAMVRSFKNNTLTFIDRKIGQLCPGGNYFLNITHPPVKEICDVYVKDEGVFKNNSICRIFLNKLPKYPKAAKKRYILFTPLIKENKEPNIIILLANPAQVSRILGLSAYKKISYPSSIIPAMPMCTSIYAPVESKRIHLNFIDYYDRYYQGKQGRRLLWKNSDLIISMPYFVFKEIIEHIPLSAHGNFKPKIKLQKFDPI